MPAPQVPHASPLTYRADQLVVMDDDRVLKDLKDRESFGLERGAIRCAEFSTFSHLFLHVLWCPCMLRAHWLPPGYWPEFCLERERLLAGIPVLRYQ